MEVGAASLLGSGSDFRGRNAGGWSLCIIDLPTLFLQPEKVSTAKIGSLPYKNLSKELTHLPGSGQSLAVFGVP